MVPISVITHALAYMLYFVLQPVKFLRTMQVSYSRFSSINLEFLTGEHEGIKEEFSSVLQSYKPVLSLQINTFYVKLREFCWSFTIL